MNCTRVVFAAERAFVTGTAFDTFAPAAHTATAAGAVAVNGRRLVRAMAAADLALAEA